MTARCYTRDLNNNAVFESIMSHFSKVMRDKEDELFVNGSLVLTDDIKKDVKAKMSIYLQDLIDNGLLLKEPIIHMREVTDPNFQGKAVMMVVEPNQMRECLGINKTKSLIYNQDPNVH